MLPQMMPMPWTLIFIFLVSTFSMVSLSFLSQHLPFKSVHPLKVKSNFIKLNW